MSKGNGEAYASWVETLHKQGFEITWSLGAPWTLWQRKEVEKLLGFYGEEKCLEEGCDFVVPKSKDPVTSLRSHNRIHQ